MKLYRQRVPIHLEVKDHVIFGLTARQCLLIGSGLAAGYLTFLNTAGWGLFLNVLLSVLPAGLGALAAFFQPLSRGLEEWAIIWLVFASQPRRYLVCALPEQWGLCEEQALQDLVHASAHGEEEELC
ncbi:PrgI family protein [Thermogemmatispora sp.]|jgi:hypothetical protein|uniref:PrgI family protein n=1 Tax=Thermogemmatispora sp. TaxID=1968838 RepID=UPI0035E41CBD